MHKLKWKNLRVLNRLSTHDLVTYFVKKKRLSMKKV